MRRLIAQFLQLLILLILISYPAAADDISMKLEKAVELIETGKPDSSAVLLYELLDSITDANEQVEALYYLSRAMKQLGRLGDEIKYLILAREESQYVEFADEVDLEYARLLQTTGNFDECIGVAEEFRNRHPDSPLLPEMMYISGNAYLQKNEYRRAFNIFDDIIESYEESDVSVECIMKEGLCLYKLDLIGGAIERFQYYLVKTSNGNNNADAMYYLGLCYEIMQQSENAAEMFKRLLINFPSHPEALDIFIRLGNNYLDAERFAEAQNAFLNYIANVDSTDSNYDPVLLNLERIAYRTGQYSSEIDIYEHFITKYPESRLTPSMLFDLARYYLTSGKHDMAFERYRILLTNPLYSAQADSAAFLLADAYSSTGKRDEAIAVLNELAYENSDSVRTQKFFLKIGNLNEAWEQYDQAVSWYNTTFDVNASEDLSITALMGIGRVFKKMDRWMESENIFTRILNEFPENTYSKEVYLSLSDIYFLEGRLKEAALTAEKAIKYAGESEKTDIILHIADLYEEIDENYALQLYSIVFYNDQNSPSQITKALMRYGDRSMKMGNRDRAMKAYSTVIDNGADSIAVNEAMKILSSITSISDSIQNYSNNQQ